MNNQSNLFAPATESEIPEHQHHLARRSQRHVSRQRITAFGPRTRFAAAALGSVAVAAITIGATWSPATAVDPNLDPASNRGETRSAYVRDRADDAIVAQAIGNATAALTAANGKVDASALNTHLASLTTVKEQPMLTLFPLLAKLSAATNSVSGAVAEHDRLAAEAAAKAAAAAAAAKARAKAVPAAGSRPAAPANPTEAQAIARSLLAAHGWGDDQFGCLVQLWGHESGWRTNAGNPSSGAYGIPQALPGSKMAAFGADWATNPTTQIKWGLSYISGRYGTPCGAWDAFQSKGWY